MHGNQSQQQVQHVSKTLEKAPSKLQLYAHVNISRTDISRNFFLFFWSFSCKKKTYSVV